MPPPRRAHLGDAGERRERPQQHRGALALVAADRVRAPVHAVGEVHVQVAAGTEHRGVASRRSPVGMAGRIETAQVSLDFDDPGAAGAAHEHLVEEVGGDDPGVAPVEVAREWLQCDSASRTDAGTGVGVFFLSTTLT